ncbi:MAG: nitroreductase family protein [Clostridia bacterium]|nr:nitroreductase family protein [Clostridia bacterium]
MKFENSVIDLIKKRTSTRTFEFKEIDPNLFQKLESILKDINEDAVALSGIKAKFFLSSFKNLDLKEEKKIGTYGVISGAKNYIVGIVDQDEKNAFEFGYLFEKIVLAATDLGLQTCWLGGTFKKADFEQIMELSDHEKIAIVSPLGYKKDKLRMMEMAMRKVVGANKRKPWQEIFFDKSPATPLTENEAAEYAVPLEMVRIGPSASNKQPWRVIKIGECYHFFLSRTKGYGASSFDMQLNDIGIAKCHFELSAESLGLYGEWINQSPEIGPSEWSYVCTWKAEN